MLLMDLRKFLSLSGTNNNIRYILLAVSILITLAVRLIIAGEMELIARDKGYEQKRWFWYCFFFGIVGVLMVCALPDRGSREN